MERILKAETTLEELEASITKEETLNEKIERETKEMKAEISLKLNEILDVAKSIATEEELKDLELL